MAFVQIIDQAEVCTDWLATQGWKDRAKMRRFEGSFRQPFHHAFFESCDSSEVLRAQLRAQAGPAMDWLVTEKDPQPPALLISDMDSTIIGIECIDALARRHGVGDTVTAITERAMAGEIDFTESLLARVAALEGCPLSVISAVLAEEVRLNRGARSLVDTMKRSGARTLLVSGGFTHFAESVAQMAGFEASYANVLETQRGEITGRLLGPVIDAEAKKRILLEEVARLNIHPGDTLAMGDGANDIAMLKAAGISIGYRPKPAVRDIADGVIASGNFGHLGRMLSLA